MASLTLKGNPIKTIGNLPSVGSVLPDFTLTKTDLSDVHLKTYAGKQIILNIFPSLDTATCAMSVRRFNEIANQLKNTVILCISADLPFAQKRFCGAENLDNVIPLSIFRHPELGTSLGIKITDGPLAGLLSRVVILLDPQGKVTYTQQVSEITNEPDYQAVLSQLK